MAFALLELELAGAAPPVSASTTHEARAAAESAASFTSAVRRIGAAQPADAPLLDARATVSAR